MDEYKQSAEDFCNNYNIIIDFKRGKRTDGLMSEGGLDYYVTIKRGEKRWSFWFTDSVYNKEHNIKPTKYDIFACLEKNKVGDFKSFCDEFDYKEYTENDYGRLKINKEAKKTYNAVKEEYENVQRIFGDCMDELLEIY